MTQIQPAFGHARSHLLAAKFMTANIAFLLFMIVIGLASGTGDGSWYVTALVLAIIESLFAIHFLRHRLGASESVIAWMRIRIIVGFIYALLSPVAYPENGLIGAGLDAIYVTSLAFLFFGRSTQLKMKISSVLFALFWAGLLATYFYPLENDGPDLSEVYSLETIKEESEFDTMLPDNWKIRDPDSYAQESPAAVAWFVEPRSDSHIMIVREDLLDLEVTHNQLVSQILTNQESLGELTILEQDYSIDSDFERTNMMTSVSSDENVMSFSTVVLTNSREGIYIFFFADEYSFESFLPDFDRFLSIFSPDMVQM